MLKFFRTKPKTTSEQKLEDILNILFPPYEKQTLNNGDKILIDFSIDMNLEAALADLEDGHNDKTSQRTIKKCIERLISVRKILEAYGEIDNTDFKYIVVDDMTLKEDEVDEKIQVSDREY